MQSLSSLPVFTIHLKIILKPLLNLQSCPFLSGFQDTVLRGFQIPLMTVTGELFRNVLLVQKCLKKIATEIFRYYLKRLKANLK